MRSLWSPANRIPVTARPKKMTKSFLAPLPDDMPEHLRDALDSPHGRLTRAIVKGLVPAIHEHVAKQITAATNPLLARIAELEARPALKYVGVWRADTIYRPGEITTDHGSSWHCERSTTQRPGVNEDWTLMVKRGRDSK